MIVSGFDLSPPRHGCRGTAGGRFTRPQTGTILSRWTGFSTNCRDTCPGSGRMLSATPRFGSLIERFISGPGHRSMVPDWGAGPGTRVPAAASPPSHLPQCESSSDMTNKTTSSCAGHRDFAFIPRVKTLPDPPVREANRRAIRSNAPAHHAKSRSPHRQCPQVPDPEWPNQNASRVDLHPRHHVGSPAGHQ
jgi:hypothetical protein